MSSRDILLADETLFSHEEVFSHDYLPDEFLFRDDQLKEMTIAIKPAMRGGKPSNLFLIGPTGTGKTSCVRKVFSEVKEATSSVIPVHINCQILSTQYKIMAEIQKAITGIPPPDTGMPLTKVQDEIFSYLKRKGKTLLVALDDIIPLFSGDTADKLLYSLLRAHETYEGVKVAIFAISTEDMLHNLDDRVRSIFMPSRVEFHKYSKSELFEILQERAMYGLYPNVISDENIKKIAGTTQDARVAIDTLRKAALFAEADASKKITSAYVEKAIGEHEEGKKPKLDIDQQMVYSIIKEEGPIESGELFELAKQKKEYSYTTFYRIIKKLESLGVIETQRMDKKKGKTSLIKAK